MTVPMGSAGQPDFGEPIALMKDCHRRIERFLGVLQKVLERYEGGPLDEQGRAALQTALDYFREAAPRHTADEEASLFPRMRGSDDPAVQGALGELDRLEADHRRAEQAHARLDTLGRRWLGDGGLNGLDLAALSELLDELTAAYMQHISLEEDRVFALAERVLDAAQLDAVGQEMKARRVASPGRADSRCATRRRAAYTDASPADRSAD